MHYREIIYSTPLLSGVTVFPQLDAGAAVMDARRYRHITFSFRSELDATVTLWGDLWAAVPASVVQWTVSLNAGQLGTVYDLPAPRCDNGVYINCYPYLYIGLADDATANHSYTSLYMRMW